MKVLIRFALPHQEFWSQTHIVINSQSYGYHLMSIASEGNISMDRVWLCWHPSKDTMDKAIAGVNDQFTADTSNRKTAVLCMISHLLERPSLPHIPQSPTTDTSRQQGRHSFLPVFGPCGLQDPGRGPRECSTQVARFYCEGPFIVWVGRMDCCDSEARYFIHSFWLINHTNIVLQNRYPVDENTVCP